LPDHAAICARDHLVIVADASLYNRKALAQRLGNKISPPETGDAELILLAFEKWGSRCLEFLYGDFAFLIFNTQNGEFFAGRDPLGVRPLFYTRMQNSFVFASELRLVLAAMDTNPEIQEDYLLDSLVGVKTPKDKTPFESIFRLAPGHFMEGKEGEIKLSPRCLWTPVTNSCKTVLSSKSEVGKYSFISLFRINLTVRNEFNPSILPLDQTHYARQFFRGSNWK